MLRLNTRQRPFWVDFHYTVEHPNRNYIYLLGDITVFLLSSSLERRSLFLDVHPSLFKAQLLVTWLFYWITNTQRGRLSRRTHLLVSVWYFLETVISVFCGLYDSFFLVHRIPHKWDLNKRNKVRKENNPGRQKNITSVWGCTKINPKLCGKLFT